MEMNITKPGLMRKRQAGLATQYQADPQLAEVIDFACTDCQDIDASHALHNVVRIDAHNTVNMTGGVHRAVGGESDAPTPGDLLCGAVALCFDSTVRVIANGMGIVLKKLRVEVAGRVDVRGTLLIDAAVPVGFQGFEVTVYLETDQQLPWQRKQRLIQAAERSCIVMQTLKGNSQVDISVSAMN